MSVSHKPDHYLKWPPSTYAAHWRRLLHYWKGHQDAKPSFGGIGRDNLNQ